MACRMPPVLLLLAACAVPLAVVGQYSPNVAPTAELSDKNGKQLTLTAAEARSTHPPPSVQTGAEADLSIYNLPRTRLENPGVQTRSSILTAFPENYFNAVSPKDAAGPAPSGVTGRRLSAAAPVPEGQNGGWTTFSVDSGVVAIHLTALSNGQLLLMERPGSREAPPQIAAVYNIYNNTWRYFPMTDSPFCAGHIQLLSDEVLIVGGDNLNLAGDFADGRYNIRVFSGGVDPTYVITDRMLPWPPALAYDPNSGARWYPTLLTMTDGNVLILSGQTLEGGGYGNEATTFVSPTYQFFELANRTVTPNQYMAQIQDTNPINLYPFATVMPTTGLVMVISGVQTRFYRYLPGVLLNDTTTYPAIPDLPVPICYPQTASVVILPLEPPHYIPRFLVVGGSSADRADGTTPATDNTYLLDLSLSPPVWQVETMSTPRVMPDLNLLPDGTMFITNGADTGVAGGVPGSGAAANLLPGARSGEIYDPSRPYGSRMSGLLASSGRDRLYHSVSWTTPNGEVLVTGSETTEDYTMQIFTPPYLRGVFTRPLLATPSTTTPAYGSTFSVALYFLSGAPVAIDRAVLNRQGGTTHSIHFDQRQVVLEFTATPTSITLTAPPDATIAPPGIYELFVVSAGRPSQAISIGLGGATPQPPFLDPPITPLFADGTYTISTPGRADSCGAFLGASDCNAGNIIAMGGQTQGVWNLTYLPHAYRPNTYSVVHQARSGSCSAILGTQPCSEGDALYPSAVDDLSGRQEWTFVPTASGTYLIEVVVGREDCNPLTTLLTASACGSYYLTMGADTTDPLAAWTVTSTAPPAPSPQPPFVPLFANGTYTITSVGRRPCGNALNVDTCAAGNAVFEDTAPATFTLVQIPSAEQPNTYNIFATDRAQCNNFLSTSNCNSNYLDLYFTDDRSGRQQFTFTPAPGGYYITVASGRTGCAELVSAQACDVSQQLLFVGADDGSGLQIWSVQSTSSASGPVVPDGGQFTLANVGRAACSSYLQPQSCTAGNGVSMGPNNETLWSFALLTTAQYNDTYEIISPSRDGQCRSYLSCAQCPSGLVDLYGFDDASGRQQFTLVRTGNGFTMQVTNGRNGCATYVAAQSCAEGAGVSFTSTIDLSSDLAIWTTATPPTPQPPAQPAEQPYFADGDYQIASLGRAACAAHLSAQPCTSSNVVSIGGGGTWTLTHLPEATVPNTYDVQYTARLSGQGACAYSYLSCVGCPGDLVDLFFLDDGSGRQQWTFAQSGAGYTITVSGGRNSCATLLSVDACGEGTDVGLISAADTSGLQLWSVSAPSQGVPPTAPLANGAYYIASAACEEYLGGSPCNSDSAATEMAPNASTDGTQTWMLAHLPDAPQPNTYNVLCGGRAACRNFLSAPACPANFVDLYLTDDSSGRQQWVITPEDAGYSITMPNGRNGCPQSLDSGTCGTSAAPMLATESGAASQSWTITPVDPAAG